MLCVNQIQVLNPKTGKIIKVPCGTCYACQSNKRSSWMFRNTIELQYAESAFFCTLTYNDASLLGLPYHASSNLRMPLKYHYQRWLKRLRKALQPAKVRYFLCHEYGDESLRPHYHVILYLDQSMSLPDMRALISDTWIYGNIQCDYVTPARIHYLTKYVTKQFRNVKVSGRSVDFIFNHLWSNRDLQHRYIVEYYLKKFSFIVASQGLGCQLLRDPAFIRWFWDHLIPGESYPTYTIGGHSYTLPRIYLKKLVPDIWREAIAPDISPEAYSARISELASDANLTTKTYVENARYIQDRMSASIRANNKKSPL